MNFYNFVEQVVELLRARLGDEYSVKSNKVLKNNSVVYDGIWIKKDDQNIVPSIYLEPFFRKFHENEQIENVVDEVIELYNHVVSHPFDLGGFKFDLEHISKNVFFKLVNYERNRVLLHDSVYIRVNDLAAVCYFCVGNREEGVSAVRFTKEYCYKLKMHEDEVIRLAKENSEKIFAPVLKPISDLLGKNFVDCIENQDMDIDTGMYVLSNETGINGASCVLYDGLLDKYYEKFGEDFYILPSSVHEVILIPTSKCENQRYLEEMVQMVNENDIDIQDYLSDRVYHYPFDSFELLSENNEE